MALLAWNEMYSVGHAMLDSDHRILINLLNQLHDAAETGQSREVVGTVVNVLAEYTEHHFRREEALMAAAGYPGLEAHRAAHRDLEAKVRDLRDRWNAGDRSVVEEDVLEMLKKWLTEHILGADKSYEPWVEGIADSGGSAGGE
ncbi:bacteriohemerythrin [Magnetospirillum aberrantis]|uniref:Hemerythrin family protein n=1 Tax=Magnetospirillum aberrantis SpK TaxID=908842 RepID=A0A7C9QUX8_9PROT|nr:bacteriohemerythrin [Magnetospirillum aberrantis]NFV81218.1 hemerythrin family protein [Magnetospirillum aberrantis SpK]